LAPTIATRKSIRSASVRTSDSRSSWWQTEADYDTPPGLKLRDEIGRYYRIGEALWAWSSPEVFSAKSSVTVTSSAFIVVHSFSKSKKL
jgi:hypothetical protein